LLLLEFSILIFSGNGIRNGAFSTGGGLIDLRVCCPRSPSSRESFEIRKLPAFIAVCGFELKARDDNRDSGLRLRSQKQACAMNPIAVVRRMAEFALLTRPFIGRHFTGKSAEDARG
jgi:hypothetical protein